MPTLYSTIVRPLITEKALTAREAEGSLVFEVAANATKTEVKQAVEKLFNVKVRQGAPCRQVFWLPARLEEVVCEPCGRRKGAGLCGRSLAKVYVVRSM